MTAGLWYAVGFSIAVGVAMPAFWVVAIATGGVPEIAEGRRDIWFHVAAEILTAAALLSGAAATLASPDGRWSLAASCLGLGLLLSSITQSPGYYVERREWPMVALFGAIWLGAVPAIVLRVTG
ncbi:MAG: hypothetical protein KQH83_03810 [Actinobacteria bacterium]|nr:hypothetical protein [Actinomycetota bacterium]